MSNLEEKLNRALNEAKEEETLNQAEMDAVQGGSLVNVSKGECGDTTVINEVPGCACTIVQQPTGNGNEVKP